MKVTNTELRRLLDDLQEDYHTYASTRANVDAMEENNPDFDFAFFHRFVAAKHKAYLESRNAILALID